MGNVVGRRYRYGASFVDRLSGVRFEGHHPLLRPDLWRLYLNEAHGNLMIAIGHYHSHTPGLSAAYQQKVLDAAGTLFRRTWHQTR